MSDIVVKRLGRADYADTYAAMRAHNRASGVDTPDEIWLLEHPPVFTLGLAARPEHVLAPGAIPVVRIDRGGQVTYHGPGQLVVYLLLNLRRRPFGVKSLVRRIEQALIDLVAGYGIEAIRLDGMPGVYVRTRHDTTLPLSSTDVARHAKLAAIGLRVAHHATYHGLSLNVDMDLEPFQRINPCGYQGLAVTQLRDLGVTDKMPVLADKLVAHLVKNLD